jgi:tetratricopeptide (TPR) repeat protein
MVKILPKIRGKRKKAQELSTKQDLTSSSSISKPARRSLHVDIEDDERTAPIPETPSNISNSSSTLAGKEKEKLSRQEKLVAHKLAKERERTARAAAALDEKGNKLFERGYFDKAMVCYSKALKMKRRTFTNMLDDADDFDENSTKKLSKADSQVLVSMATSINNIGYLRQRSGETSAEETMAAYQKSLRIKRRILGNDSLSVGKTLNNIGSVYYLTRNFKGALDAYKEAMNIMQGNLGEHHPDIATVMSNMGDVYLANGQDENSLEYYRLALNVRYANFGKHDPRVVRLLEKIARIEIGDKMEPQGETDMGNVDWEENALTDLGMKPLPAEYRILRGELKADIEYLDKLQKRMSNNMVQDKLVIVKGMRELPEGGSFDESLRELSYLQDDASQSSQVDTEEDDTTEPLEEKEPENEESPRKCRLQALKHVNHRLDKIRSLKNMESGTEGGFDEKGDYDNTTGQSVSTTSSNELYGQLYGQFDDDDKSVSSASSEELFGQFYGPLETQTSNIQYRPASTRKGMGSQQKRVTVTS